MSHSTPVSHPACAGLDVSLENVDFFLLHGETNLSGRTLRQANELTVLATQLVGAGVELVVLEATGGLETLVWSVLEQAGLQVAIVSPSRVRHFARSLGQQAKTDRLDAALLAEFGQRMRPPITTLPHPQVRRFQQLLRHRSEVVDQRARWRCTLHRSDEPARASLKRLIALLGGEIALLEQQLAEAAAALPAMATVTDRLQTAPGIGRTTAWTLLAELPELGRISGREAASLAGLAPRARDSGARQAPRSIGGGRPRVRRALFIAAWNARRSDSSVAAFYDRLLAAGKPKKVIHIAIARKLLVALNSMLHHQSNWRSTPPT